MCQGYRRGFTAAEKAELWDRWQRGESLKAIGRAFGKPSSAIYFQLAPHGGIRPAPRRRSRLALTLSEREEISRGIAAYQSTRSMARLLGHSPSTVSREISRNGGYDRYRAALADEKAWLRAPLVPGISEDKLDEGEEAACAPIEDEQSAVAILHSGRVDDDVQQQAERVDQDIRLRPVTFLAASKPCGSSVEPPFEPLWRFDCR